MTVAVALTAVSLVFSQTELILQPIVLSCRTGNSRVIAIAINCLQKLVIFQAFPRVRDASHRVADACRSASGASL